TVRSRTSRQPRSQAGLLGAGVLPDQAMHLEGRHEAEHGRLVPLQPARQVGDPHFRLAPQELEDLERPVQRLHFVARHETGAHGTTTIAAETRPWQAPKALW